MTATRQSVALLAASPLLLALVLATGCSRGPKPIRYGQDECADCKMTLIDQHYGAELVTPKGKVHIFDDLNCLVAFHRRAASTRTGETPSFYVTEFNRPGTLLAADQAVFLHHDRIRSPMSSGIAAFPSEAALEEARRQFGGGGRVLRWTDVMATP